MSDGAQRTDEDGLLALFDGLLARDGAGGSWLGPLLRAAPRGPERFGERAEGPGWLEVPLAVPTADGRRGAFGYRAAPSRALLGWFIDHPSGLTSPTGLASTPEADRLRRALLRDEPTGSRERAQDRAHTLLRRGAPLGPVWWAFEDSTELTCALITDRIVLVVVDGVSAADPATPWYPRRTALVRDLEAARRLSDGRSWGALVIGGRAALGVERAAELVAAGAPHETEAGQAELAAGYLGQLDLAAARSAVGTPPAAAQAPARTQRPPAR